MPAERGGPRPGWPPTLALLTGAAERIVAELGGRERLALAGIGWATVELGRAERELGEALGPDLLDGFGPAADDTIMGAYCRLGRLTGRLDLVLLEPNTEGRLAAALVRWGEAVVVAYVVAPARWRGERGGPVDGRAGQLVSSVGPLGPARHLASGRRGPHLILVGRPADRAPAASAAMPRDTIAS